MAKINNILAQKDNIYHIDGTLFDKSFSVMTDSDTDSSFDDLTDYDHLFRIYSNQGGSALLTLTDDDEELIVTDSGFRITKNISLPLYGKLYFDYKITNKTDADKVYIIWYGSFYNEK